MLDAYISSGYLVWLKSYEFLNENAQFVQQTAAEILGWSSARMFKISHF